VVAVAKRNLKAGERLDGVGGFCTYGLIENSSAAREMNALPIGLSEGCVLCKDVAKDDVVSMDDLQPAGETLIWKLWHEQNERWPAVAQTPAAVASLSETR
jgi:predicted homoserine dehydrogenase-like protein